MRKTVYPSSVLGISDLPLRDCYPPCSEPTQYISRSEQLTNGILISVNNSSDSSFNDVVDAAATVPDEN